MYSKNKGICINVNAIYGTNNLMAFFLKNYRLSCDFALVVFP